MTSEDFVQSAADAGLRYVSDSDPGIRRLRRGEGFVYRTQSGKPPDKTTRARIKALVIPPAWEDVWICASPRGHLQATGRDARGRKQYRYHAEFRSHREESKYDRLAEYGDALPQLRAALARDTAHTGLPRRRVVALAIDLLERTLIRVGNETYAAENGSFGITTLRNRHVNVVGENIRFAFKGKSGKQHEITLTDKRVGRIMQRLQDLPGQQLMQYKDGAGEPQPITSGDINQYLRDAMGADFTAKDVRTWSGTLFAASLLGRQPAPETAAEAKRVVAEVVREVAGQLHNTPAVCRACYMHPGVIEGYENGTLQRHFARPVRRRRRYLASDEVRLLQFLKALRKPSVEVDWARAA